MALAITVPIIYPFAKSYHGVFYIWAVPLIIATILWWILVNEPPCPSTEIESEKTLSLGLKQILKNRTLWLLAFILLLHNIFFYTWSGWLPTYLLHKGLVQI